MTVLLIRSFKKLDANKQQAILLYSFPDESVSSEVRHQVESQSKWFFAGAWVFRASAPLQPPRPNRESAFCRTPIFTGCKSYTELLSAQLRISLSPGHSTAKSYTEWRFRATIPNISKAVCVLFPWKGNYTAFADVELSAIKKLPFGSVDVNSC